MDYLIAIICSVAVITSFLAIETRARIKSVLLLVLFTASIGIAFIYIGALYSGIFQLLVYSGVITVLFAATAYFVNNENTDPIVEVTT